MKTVPRKEKTSSVSTTVFMGVGVAAMISSSRQKRVGMMVVEKDKVKAIRI
jgi:hypothetical protein